MRGGMHNAVMLKSCHLSVSVRIRRQHCVFSASVRFLASAPPIKDNRRIGCHLKNQGFLKCNRFLGPFCVEQNYKSFNNSNYWSKGNLRSHFGQNSVNANNFNQLSRCIVTKASKQTSIDIKWMKSLLFHLLRATATFCLLISLVIIGAPSFLSLSTGLHTAVFLTNKVIPGKASIKSMSVGWTKPLTIEDVLLQGVDGDAVLNIPKIETKAPLWSLISGKAGFGDCSITSPMIDLQEEKGTGLSRLALAVTSREKLKGQQKKRVSKRKMTIPSVRVNLSLNIKAPGGDFQVINGKLILPEDVAAVIGKRLVAEVLLGHFATENGQVSESTDDNSGFLPLRMGLWSECTEAKAEGFLDPKKMQIHLVNPIKLEIDLTPDVGRIYLRRINPLLGEILGPAVVDEDMPDMVVYVSPRNMMLPAEHFALSIEPMKVVVARGPLVGGILSLLSKGRNNIIPKKQEIRVETSSINADFDTGGSLTCARFDLLLAGRLHVASWGTIDLIEENIEMILAIPETTLREVMGLSSLPKSYYLKIPIKGTFDQPQIDWNTASFNIAQQMLQDRSNKFMKSILKELSPPEEPIPELNSSLPWESGEDPTTKEK